MTDNLIETDYLVVGAGAAGMAFTDSLLTDSDADIVIVDRRHRPGGHWNDAYPFVRLHQPSAYYGVNSVTLGEDRIDTFGINAGMYERATGPEIVAYFDRVMNDRFVPSGRVRFLAMTDYLGRHGADHRVESIVTGEQCTVKIRKKLVDATFLEASVPSRRRPSFQVDPDARLIPVNGLTELSDAASGYTIIGAGKTAMDACSWLLDIGLPADAIRWIRPRDSWLLNRKYQQPLSLVPWLIEGVSLQQAAAAEADSLQDLFRRLEDSSQLLRIDPSVEPTMYRCATISTAELDALRAIENVVRLGHVTHIGTSQITLDEGSIKTDPRQVHVDCTATGLPAPPPRPMFEPDRITVQCMRMCQPMFNTALIAYVEATRDNDDTKNALCPPNPYPSTATDWITVQLIAQAAEASWLSVPDIEEWKARSRLNAARGMHDYGADPRMQSAITRLLENMGESMTNLTRLAKAHPHHSSPFVPSPIAVPS